MIHERGFILLQNVLMIILELAKDLNIIEEYESVDNGALYKREK